MPAPLIGLILVEAAKSYAQSLGTTVGQEAAETLFRQAEIASRLRQIEAKLDEILDFLKTQLPGIVKVNADKSIAENELRKLKASINTMAVKIDVLEELHRNNVFSGTEHEAAYRTLIEVSDSCIEGGQVLADCGQQYYVGVAMAFYAGVKGYSILLLDEAKNSSDTNIVLKRAVLSRAAQWIGILTPWADPSQVNSLRSTLNAVEATYAKAAPIMPQITGRSTAFLISYRKIMREDGYTDYGLSGAWFGIQPNGDLWGDTLYQPISLPSGTPLDLSTQPMRFSLPSWWTVRVDVPASMGDYEACAAQLSGLISAFRTYPSQIAVLKPAVACVEGMLGAARLILNAHERDMGADANTTNAQRIAGGYSYSLAHLG